MEKEKNLSDVRLPGESFLNIDDPDLDFAGARKAAEKRVHTYDSEPMLVGWYDKKREKGSPGVTCEEEGGEPGWVNNAKGHGADLTVNINHGEYLFLFRSKHQFERS